MMLSYWTQFLLFANIAVLLVGVVVALQVDNACFFWSGTPECSQHRLQCDRGTIFLTQAVRGFKPLSHPCRPGEDNCVKKTTCCRNDTGQDCLETYTQGAFSDFTRECWNRQSCNHTVQYAQKTSCSWNYANPSGYSEVQYTCLDDSAIHDFSDSNPMTVSSLALRYLSSHGSGVYVCLASAEDCIRRTSSVLLTRWPNTNFQDYCSSLSVNGEDWLPCSSSVLYKTYTLTTPFVVWLNVVNDKDIAQAWAVINADDSSSLRVGCKPWTSDVSFTRCSPSTVAPAAPLPTSQRTDSTAFPSSPSTGTSGATATGALSTDTSSLASGPGSDVTEAIVPQSAANTGNTAAVVGGVVGAVVVVLLVAMALVVIYVRRRSKPAASNAQPGEDNSAYSGLSDVTRFQPRTQTSYESLGHNPDISRNDNMSAGEDNSVYSGLSDMTRFQPRTQADYESLGHDSDVSRSPDGTQPGGDNSAYSRLSDLTREQPRSSDSYETLGRTGRAGQKNASTPGEQSYINFEK